MITVKKSGNYYDVTLGGITIYGCTHMAGTSAKTGNDYDFISFPRRKATKDGVDKWYDIVAVSKEVHSQIHTAILEAEGVKAMPEKHPFEDDSEIPF